VPSQRHCAHAAWKKAGYGALKARARSQLRLRDNASFARLSVCGLVDSEEIFEAHVTLVKPARSQWVSGKQ